MALSLTRMSLTSAAEACTSPAAPSPTGTHHPSVRVVCRPAATAGLAIANPASPVDQEQVEFVPEGLGGNADATSAMSPDQPTAPTPTVLLKGGAMRQLFAASPQAALPRASRKASLRLLPVEPPARYGAPDTSLWLPDGSPRLESPLHRLHTQWIRAAAGLEEGRAPRLAPAGTGGAYFLVDRVGAFVAVFKPADEEPLAINNPKGRRGSSGSVADGTTPVQSASATAALTTEPCPGPDGGPWSLAALTTALRDAAAAAAAKGAASALVAGAWGAAPGEGLRRGLRPGEGAAREVAAYLLDWGGFSGVPPTAMVRLELGAASSDTAPAPDAPICSGQAAATAAAAKVGSLQAYVDAEADCEEMGVSAFPVHEVHKIAVLDLRLGNTDRHAANILASRRSADEAWELTPIDHGCCLPDSFEDFYFEWATWPQAQVPFDEPTRAYIAALDAGRDAAALAAHGLEMRPECLRTLRVTTALLQKGAAAGLTPAQIAGLASRQSESAPSPLERMHAAACTATAPCGASAAACVTDEPDYLRRMAALIDTAVADAALDAPGALLL